MTGFPTVRPSTTNKFTRQGKLVNPVWENDDMVSGASDDDSENGLMTKTGSVNEVSSQPGDKPMKTVVSSGNKAPMKAIVSNKQTAPLKVVGVGPKRPSPPMKSLVPFGSSKPLKAKVSSKAKPPLKANVTDKATNPKRNLPGKSSFYGE